MLLAKNEVYMLFISLQEPADQICEVLPRIVANVPYRIEQQIVALDLCGMEPSDRRPNHFMDALDQLPRVHCLLDSLPFQEVHVLLRQCALVGSLLLDQPLVLNPCILHLLECHQKVIDAVFTVIWQTYEHLLVIPSVGDSIHGRDVLLELDPVVHLRVVQVRSRDLNFSSQAFDDDDA